MKKPETPIPDTWSPQVQNRVQGYLDDMTPRPWTQGSSTHEVVRHPDDYHIFDCHHGRDGQGAAYIVNAMPAAIARIKELEKALSSIIRSTPEISGGVARISVWQEEYDFAVQVLKDQKE